MDQNHEDLSLIINRFPEHADAFKLYFQSNRVFRSMCEDFRKCHDALDYWALLRNKGNDTICKEYEALIEELEAEILYVLKENGLNY